MAAPSIARKTNQYFTAWSRVALENTPSSALEGFWTPRSLGNHLGLSAVYGFIRHLCEIIPSRPGALLSSTAASTCTASTSTVSSGTRSTFPHTVVSEQFSSSQDMQQFYSYVPDLSPTTCFYPLRDMQIDVSSKFPIQLLKRKIMRFVDQLLVIVLVSFLEDQSDGLDVSIWDANR